MHPAWQAHRARVVRIKCPAAHETSVTELMTSRKPMRSTNRAHTGQQSCVLHTHSQLVANTSVACSGRALSELRRAEQQQAGPGASICWCCSRRRVCCWRCPATAVHLALRGCAAMLHLPQKLTAQLRARSRQAENLAGHRAVCAQHSKRRERSHRAQVTWHQQRRMCCLRQACKRMSTSSLLAQPSSEWASW